MSEDDAASDRDANEGDDEFSDGENTEAASAESLHLVLNTEDVEDTQCKFSIIY